MIEHVLFWLAYLAVLFFTRRQRIFWPLLALALLLAFNHAFTKGFFDLEFRDGHLYGTRIDILNRGSQVMLLALGMTLVIATGGVDLSVGAVMAMAGTLMAFGLVEHGWSPGVAVAIALVLATAAGAWNGTLVAFFGIQPIVATLILMVAGRGVAQLISGGQIVTFSNPTLEFLGNGFLLALPFTVILVAVMLGITSAFTRGTALGLFIESVGDNDNASRFAGVEARVVKFVAYLFTGFCAGLAGLLAASNIRAGDPINSGLYLELDAILAVVVGGTALTGGRYTLLGSIVGALLIQTLTTTMYARGVSAYVAPIPKALVIIAVCLLQSEKVRRWVAKLVPQGKSA